MNVIAKPFGALMLLLYNLVGNYGLAIFLFALVVNLVLLPFQMKSKRSMMRMSRFTPKLKELEKKYANNQQKYQAEVAKLYKQEKVNPMSGCLWSPSALPHTHRPVQRHPPAPDHHDGGGGGAAPERRRHL